MSLVSFAHAAETAPRKATHVYGVKTLSWMVYTARSGVFANQDYASRHTALDKAIKLFGIALACSELF